MGISEARAMSVSPAVPLPGWGSGEGHAASSVFAVCSMLPSRHMSLLPDQRIARSELPHASFRHHPE